MHRSTSGVRRACAVGTTIALIGLTTGLGVLGVTSASAAEPVEPTTTATTPTTVADQSTPTDAPSDSATPSGAATDTATPSDAPTSDGTDAPTAPPTSTPTDPATAPATTGTSKAPAGGVSALAVASEAQIVGDAKVGVTLRADAPKVTGPYDYAWSTDGGVTVASTSSVYVLTGNDVGKQVTVVITGKDGDTATATTAAVTEDVAFATPTTADAPRTIEVTAGDTLDEVFTVAQGSGDVTYALGYAQPDYADPTDPEDQPDSYLPYDSVFDAGTATLRGQVISAGVFDFAVIASNGTSTATEYVEVVVDPGKAIGIMASATDQTSDQLYDGTHTTNAWIIEPDGSIVTITFPADIAADPTIVDGGQPTVKQGASLWINGSPVDQFGNDTTQYDDEGNAPLPTVTSDHATDQIAFDEDEFATKVTFPTASTHRLTVAQDGQSVSFPVVVDPTVAVVAAATPATPKGQLAFTGSDTTDALPWALAMLAAGAGLVGLRALRRRTQR